MSVLCLYTPEMPIQIACREQPAWREGPLALLGPNERVCAVSAQARRQAVAVEMTPQQALSRCPELQLHPVSMGEIHAAQAAFEEVLAAWEVPVEILGWGTAYMALQGVAADALQVAPLAAHLGQTLRRQMGADLTSSLGWDSGKFTARAAAVRTAVGHMRLVGKAEEVSFLSPLPITLLPLPTSVHQQLHWLGIRSLGQFARMPTAAVYQSFGRAGQLAQQWAQGKDHRPVLNTLLPAATRLTMAFEPPCRQLDPCLARLMAELAPTLDGLAHQFLGIRHLRLNLAFLVGTDRETDVHFVTPENRPSRLQAALAQALTRLIWPGELLTLQVRILAVGELPLGQLSLLDHLSESPPSPTDLAARLRDKYGSLFFRGEMVEPFHPVSERRAEMRALP